MIVRTPYHSIPTRSRELISKRELKVSEEG